jgi:hypothetical protein
MSRTRPGLGVLAVLALIFSLSACVTQLAPPYDKAVVDALNDANVATMTILASASAGTKADGFPSREQQYNRTIGKLDALALLAGARPVPKNRVSMMVNQALEKRGTTAIAEDDATPPSVAAIRKVSETLVKMRDTDQKQGVTETEVQAFRGQAVICFDQAITYENFLQR